MLIVKLFLQGVKRAASDTAKRFNRSFSDSQRCGCEATVMCKRKSRSGEVMFLRAKLLTFVVRVVDRGRLQ